MIALLLLIAVLILSGIGVGVYLIVRPGPEPSPEADPAPTPPVTSTRPGTTTPGTATAPAPGGGTGAGTTAIEPPPGGTDLRSVAAGYVDAVNARDEAAATALTCRGTDPGTLFSVSEGREVTLTGVEVIEGPVASATVLVGDDETALLMENEEDRWCVAI
ncbi:hypothetical protein [Actinophytocola gossypii]|uniref:Uncharacterized protein n=1 Tax=Actinophytocola gossypii TaxID=2812003 RepID=A0ABT2J6W7_9PSEU|nr:hypothetical protein [Actinophytocola gossypii]MCT2583603.1 hypothetical protein [Actinophytocola gossypii]